MSESESRLPAEASAEMEELLQQQQGAIDQLDLLDQQILAVIKEIGAQRKEEASSEENTSPEQIESQSLPKAA